jgi:MFS family permease
MDGVIFALISPLIIKEFAIDIPTYRTGFQIWLTLGITGLYFWPWLSDRVGRRNLLAVNIAMFSLMMPIVALSPSFAVFVAARALLTFALNGEWSLGSMLVAETWPAHLRGRIISINRATWCFGASFAGAITGLVAGTWGWRAAVMVPGVIALLAVYVRATCPESPYWVRAQDRKRRIADTLAAGGTLNAEDRTWSSKADKVGIRQVFMPDVLPATLVATFVTCCSCCIYGTVGAWMPLYLSTEKHWSTAEYSTFYVFWGLVGFFGLCAAGWLADKIGRRGPLRTKTRPVDSPRNQVRTGLFAGAKEIRTLRPTLNASFRMAAHMGPAHRFPDIEVRHQAKIRGSSDSLRKSGSQETPRWRKADSNSWSHLWMQVSLGERDGNNGVRDDVAGSDNGRRSDSSGTSRRRAPLLKSVGASERTSADMCRR